MSKETYTPQKETNKSRKETNKSRKETSITSTQATHERTFALDRLWQPLLNKYHIYVKRDLQITKRDQHKTYTSDPRTHFRSRAAFSAQISHIRQKRPEDTKRDQSMTQKRPINDAKETYNCI